MILTLTQAAADVSALTGASVARSDPRLRLFLPRAAAAAVSAAPLPLLSGALPVEGEIYASGIRPDVGLVPLPRDFLRLVSFRLKGWPCDVTRLTGPEEGHPFLLRGSPWPEIAGSPEAPKCYRVPFPGGEAIEFHAAPCEATKATMLSALYFPRPALRGQEIRIPDALVSEVITLAADMFLKYPHPGAG